VAYRQVDIEAYEESCLQVSTSQSVAAHAQSSWIRQPMARRVAGGGFDPKSGSGAHGQS